MIGSPDSRYPTMSVLNTQLSLPDSKFESGEEQVLPNEIWFYEAKLKLQYWYQ
jgi:hypothetical protein